MNIRKAKQKTPLLVLYHCGVGGMPRRDIRRLHGGLERYGAGLECVSGSEGGLKRGMGGELHGGGSVEDDRLVHI